MWRNVTVTYPLILDLFKMKDKADTLRSFSNSNEGIKSAADFLRENKKEIYANAYADANANAYANADANANAYAYADANAYANAYADANAYAYGDAYALREKIVAVSLETLRMAIEVS